MLTIKKNFQIIGLMTLAVLYYLLSQHGYILVANLFGSENFELLNKLTSVTDNQSVSFYQAQFEKNLFGPGLNIISALFLILLFYLLNFTIPSGLLACIIFAFLILTRMETLRYPPYEVPISGSWLEAMWLKRHHFDYAGLLNQAEFSSGGPKVYVFSLYPGFIALLMHILPNNQVFLIVNHLLVFGGSALCITLFRNILMKIIDERSANLSALVLLFLPLFQSMSELLNMEIPILSFTLLAVYFLTKKDIRLASVMALLAVAIKGSGIVACATVFTMSVLLFFAEPSFSPHYPERKQNIFWGLLAVLAIGGIIACKGIITANPLANNKESFLSGLQIMMKYSRFLPSIFLVCTLGMGTVFLKDFFICRQKPYGNQLNFLAGHYIPLVMLCGFLFWFGLYVNFPVLIPRYKLLLAPFGIFIVIYLIANLVKPKKLQQLLIMVMILAGAFCSYGSLYKKNPGQWYYYVHTERSLEYRYDLKLYLDIAEDVEQKFSDYKIGAPPILAHALAFVEMGYVTKPLDVMLYGVTMDTSYGGISNFTGLKNVDIQKTIWLAFEDGYSKDKPYPVHPQDKILKVYESGEHKATMFMGGFSIEKMRQFVMQKYIEMRLKEKQN